MSNNIRKPLHTLLSRSALSKLHNIAIPKPIITAPNNTVMPPNVDPPLLIPMPWLKSNHSPILGPSPESLPQTTALERLQQWSPLLARTNANVLSMLANTTETSYHKPASSWTPEMIEPLFFAMRHSTPEMLALHLLLTNLAEVTTRSSRYVDPITGLLIEWTTLQWPLIGRQCFDGVVEQKYDDMMLLLSDNGSIRYRVRFYLPHKSRVHSMQLLTRSLNFYGEESFSSPRLCLYVHREPGVVGQTPVLNRGEHVFEYTSYVDASPPPIFVSGSYEFRIKDTDDGIPPYNSKVDVPFASTRFVIDVK